MAYMCEVSATATPDNNGEWSVPADGGGTLLGDLCGAVKVLANDVDRCSSDIKHINELIEKMENDAELKKFMPPAEQEFMGLVKRFDNLVNDHENLLMSHKSSTVNIAEMQTDLDAVKRQLADVQKELHSSSFYEQSMSIEGGDNSKQRHGPGQTKNEAERKRWSWGEFATLKEMTERLSRKLKKVEGIVARMTQSESPRRLKVDPFINGLREVVEKQIVKNREEEQQRTARQGERNRSSSKTKRDSGYQDSLIMHSTPQDPPLQYQMSNASSIPESPMPSETSPITTNPLCSYPKTIPEDKMSAQDIPSDSESLPNVSRSDSFPRTPNSFADSSYASLRRDAIDSGEPHFDAFLQSLLEFIDHFESNTT